MASGLFNSYEVEYATKSTELAGKIERATALPADQTRNASRELEAAVRDVEQLLQRMDMEARSYSPDQARQLLQKVKEYKADLAKLKEDARRAAAAGSGGAAGADARTELGLAGDYFATSAGQRDRLLTATDRLNKTGDRIQQGRQQLLETEAVGAAILADLQRQRQQIQHAGQQAAQADASVAQELGVQILSDLQRQRETILHSRDTLHTVDTHVSRSRQILQTMSRRIVQNKAIMWGIILLLLGAIGLVVWAKF